MELVHILTTLALSQLIRSSEAESSGGNVLDAKPLPPVPISDPTDEDLLSSGTEWGHGFLRSEINQHIEAVVARLSGVLWDVTSAKDNYVLINKYPIFTILMLTKRIMQTACVAVRRNFFDLAFDTFITLQVETFLFNEPHIRFDTYNRIVIALSKCLNASGPHIFIRSENGTRNLTTTETCDDGQVSVTSNVTVRYSKENEEQISEFSIPAHTDSKLNSSGGGGNSSDLYAEPLIETVWKMVLHSHSYCFKYFNEHYNDHHTFTVLILQLFQNQIQELWLRGYVLDNTRENKLYGGLLGDVKRILMNVDNCAGAATTNTPYPWFIARPNFNRKSILVDVNATPAPPPKVAPAPLAAAGNEAPAAPGAAPAPAPAAAGAAPSPPAAAAAPSAPVNKKKPKSAKM